MVGHRYWRIIRDTSQQDQNYFLLSEVAFATVAGGPSITTGGTPIAGSSYGGLPPQSAFDGNPGSVWCSAGGGPFWIGYDFGVAVDPVECRLTVNDYYPDERLKTGRIQYSDDGASWTDRVAIAPAWGMNGATQTEAFSLIVTAHRYWRLKFDSTYRTDNKQWPGLAELQLYAAPNLVDRLTLLGGVPISGNDVYGAASNAFDNDLATEWQSGVTQTWIGWDFQATPRTVTAMGVVARDDKYGDGGPSYCIGSGGVEYSDDGVNWTRLIPIDQQAAWGVNERRVFSADPTQSTMPKASQSALVVPTLTNPPAQLSSSAMVVVMGETPPASGGAVVASAAIVLVQVEFKQPYRNVELPLMCGPWAFPLWIAKGI